MTLGFPKADVYGGNAIGKIVVAAIGEARPGHHLLQLFLVWMHFD